MIGIVEANPLLSIADLDGVRQQAEAFAQNGVVYTTVIQNEATFDRPAIDYTQKRDPRADSLILASWTPTYRARRIARVGEWLDATPEIRAAWLFAATVNLS